MQISTGTYPIPLSATMPAALAVPANRSTTNSCLLLFCLRACRAVIDCYCQNLSDQLFRNMKSITDVLLWWCSVLRASELEVMLE